MNYTPILALPPEIYPIVASHIPLRRFPATLSALALTCSQIKTYVTYLLYSKVIIRDEYHAHKLLDRIYQEKELGLLIRELHIIPIDRRVIRIMSNETPSLYHKLHHIVTEKLLSRLTRLNLVLFQQPFRTDTYVTTTLEHPSKIPREFWADLHQFCPNLRGEFFHWLKDTSVGDSLISYELEGLSHSTERIMKLPDPKLGLVIFTRDLSNSLRSLKISFRNRSPVVNSLLSITFPHLKCFSVSSGYLMEIEHAMDFWVRHPGLERLTLVNDNYDRSWFSNNLEGVLPRLTYLKASYKNVRALTSQLGQLQHLSITDSQNCQIPYLLRSVIPGGLPKLKSLEINQWGTPDLRDEGTRWYEKVSGRIIEDACMGESIQTMPVGFIHSIVRGAPNLEELCLQGEPIFPSHIRAVSRHIAQFRYLERFYFRAFRHGKLQKGDINSFLSTCRIIGTSCRTINLVTDVSVAGSGEYLTGKIIRDSGGEVTEVLTGRGFGMEFTGGDENPFPYNPLRL